MTFVDLNVREAGQGTNRNGTVRGIRSRVRVDGKFFALGKQRLRIHGVTYGPFRPNAEGQPFSSPDRVADDFARMRRAGINSIRTYHLPPEWLLDRADEQGLGVFVDVPWPKHVCFLDSRQAEQDARRAIRYAAEQGHKHGCILAYSIGNEIPSPIVRWHGARRIQSFLAELHDVAKQADPDGLVTYANYPPTEYLDLSFLDFVTFNVYLHDRETFRRYLFRLQNLVGDRPLLLGEIGMDTLRHGEREQADFLAGHVREAVLMGLAGVFVFAWTDDWYTGGYAVQDWTFGISRADRVPKASYHALREVFRSSPAGLLPETPRVSVVVCTYNGGRTLEPCLRSLLALDYPNYEVLVVDDGSTDDTPAIVGRFPSVRAIRQANQGLSVARNVGLRAATGTVVAYTDDDCFADPDWLTHLVYQLGRGSAAAVGGPNLAPQDGRRAACVAAAPGQPTYVLESDQVAEHIPGCNMAFRREALEAINGFDPQYRKAGDDVDVCWRLQQAGFWITFAPGAFVWHHRRQTVRSYLKQQAGYGEAEALLQFKHPDKFNSRGGGKWRGVLYGASLPGLRLARAIIYRGTFGSGLFQCLYQPAPAHWAMVPGTLEWHAGVVLAGLTALFWPPAWALVAAMLGLSLGVAALQAAQASLAPEHESFRSRCLITALCYLQPLVRSWSRYRTHLSSYRPSAVDPSPLESRSERLPLTGLHTAAYWSEDGVERTELLNRAVTCLTERRWRKTIDSGWLDRDMEISCHPWTTVQICTVQEDHGGGKRLIRVRYRLRLSGYTKMIGVAALLALLLAVGLQAWLAVGGAAALLALCVAMWWSGTYRAAQAVGVFDALAPGMRLARCGPSPRAGAQPNRPRRSER